MEVEVSGSLSPGGDAAGPSRLQDVQSRITEILKNPSTTSFLEVPLKFGFQRTITNGFDFGTKTKSKLRRDSKVVYSREDKSFSNFRALHEYLVNAELPLPIFLFSFDPAILLTNFKNDKPENVLLEDISEGKERLPISLTCAKFGTPAFPESNYIADVVAAPNLKVKLDHDPEFLICCECPDDCRDKLRCPCFLKTLDNCNDKFKKEVGVQEIGYSYQRLGEVLHSGIFECNKKCRCNQLTCFNRVSQNGLWCKLQLFKTLRKGLAVRTLHYIPAGTFVCIYAGEIIGPRKATQIMTHYQSGEWKYLTELRVGEPDKEGYEAEVVPPEDPIPSTSSVLKAEGNALASLHKAMGPSHMVPDENVMAGSSDDSPEVGDLEALGSTGETELMEGDNFLLNQDNSGFTHCFPSRSNKEGQPATSSTAGKASAEEIERKKIKYLQKMENLYRISSYSTALGASKQTLLKYADSIISKDHSSSASAPKTQSQSSTDVSTGDSNSNPLSTLFSPAPLELDSTTCNEIVMGSEPEPETESVAKAVHSNERLQSLRPRQGRQSPPPIPARKSKKEPHPLLRLKYSLDASKQGNIGTFCNHSCRPNLVAQHVFWNCHDLRLPRIALFACRNIMAGEELCWDYSYQGFENGTAPPIESQGESGRGNGDKEEGLRIPCYCEEDNCTGWLYY